jgi:hypothetical protein
MTWNRWSKPSGVFCFKVRMSDRIKTGRLVSKLTRLPTPLVLLGMACGAYGVFIFQQGFHWDDWGFVWLIQTLGKPGFIDYFSTNRPFLAYVYSVTTAMLGTNPLGWHLFSLFWRWCTAVALWWVLRMVWPQRARAAFLTASFFLLYPGFNQQAIAITYSHFFMAQTMLFVSIGLMLLFARAPRRYWWAGLLGVLCSGFSLFATEYFFGLELLRPVLLWMGIRAQWPGWKDRLKRSLWMYAPFLFVLLVYLYWRVFVLGFHLYEPELVTGTGQPLVERLVQIPFSIWEQWRMAVWGAWGQAFQVPDFTAYGLRLSVFYVVLLLIVALGLYVWMKTSVAQPEGERLFYVEWLGFGLLAAVLAGIPFLLTELPVRLTFPNSRFTLPFALGAAFTLVALVEAWPREGYRMMLASALLALAVGAQFNNGYLWREDWKMQSAYFWQMTWRIPALQRGTIMLSGDTPFSFSSDNSLTFPLNLTYSPENRSNEIDHVYYSVSARLGNQLKALDPGLPVRQDYLAGKFESTTDNLVVVHYAPPGCFRVLHPVYDRDLPQAPLNVEAAGRWIAAGVPVLPQSSYRALPLSNLNQILPDAQASASPPAIFGVEPDHKWCYYFEKADLERQQGNWVGVAEIADEVFAVPYYPDDYAEYLPFVEAYAQTGHWEAARDLTRSVADQMPVLEPALCAIWQRVPVETSAGMTIEKIDKMRQELYNCPTP